MAAAAWRQQDHGGSRAAWRQKGPVVSEVAQPKLSPVARPRLQKAVCKMPVRETQTDSSSCPSPADAPADAPMRRRSSTTGGGEAAVSPPPCPSRRRSPEWPDHPRPRAAAPCAVCGRVRSRGGSASSHASRSRCASVRHSRRSASLASTRMRPPVLPSQSSM